MDKLDLIVEIVRDMREDHKDMSEKLTSIDKNVEKNTQDLAYHIKRTNLNEDRIKLIEERHSIRYLAKLIVTVAGGIGTIVGAIYGISKFF